MVFAYFTTKDWAGLLTCGWKVESSERQNVAEHQLRSLRALKAEGDATFSVSLLRLGQLRFAGQLC